MTAIWPNNAGSCHQTIRSSSKSRTRFNG